MLFPQKAVANYAVPWVGTSDAHVAKPSPASQPPAPQKNYLKSSRLIWVYGRASGEGCLKLCTKQRHR